MSYKTVFYALGTENSIILEDPDSSELLLKIVDRVSQIEEKMSAFKASSEISKIASNSGISAISVNGDVFCVLEKALEVSQASDGAFDITVRPLTKQWNSGSGTDTVPEKADIEAAKSCVGYQNLVLNLIERTAFLTKSGCKIDLGGIAKGYAANEAKRILLEHGVKSALINFGGNIMTVGNSFENTPWKIGIQNPLSGRGESILTIDIKDKALVTSAVNERFFIRDGIRYHHILNPKTGYPAQSGLLSVTIIDECSMLADALSTAVFVLGAKEGLKLIRKYNSEAIFITESGDILSSFEINHQKNIA